DGVAIARRDARLELFARQMRLAIGSGDLAFAPDEDGSIVDQVVHALEDPGHEIAAPLFRQRAQRLSRRAGDRFADLGVALARSDDRDAFGQADDVRLVGEEGGWTKVETVVPAPDAAQRSESSMPTLCAVSVAGTTVSTFVQPPYSP